MSDRELLEFIAAQVGKLTSEMDGVKSELSKVDKRFDNVDARLDKVDSRLDNVETRINDMDARFDKVDSRLDGMDKKIDSNHEELIIRLNRLEENQSSIKEFILNSDDTFRKTEETYKVIQKFKEVFSK